MTLKIIIIRSALIAVVVFNVLHAQAEIYSWKDENGKTHFGDQPFGQKNAEKVEVKEQTSTKPDPELEAYRKETREQLRISEEERVAEAKKAAESQSAQATAERCARAKDRLRVSMASTLHYDFDKNGKRFYKSNEEIEQYREKLRTFISRNCE